MTTIFKENPNDYEKAMIKWLFRIWNDESDDYTDASGVSMSFNVESEFQRVLGKDEFSGVPKVEKPEVSIHNKTFLQVEIAAMYQRVRMSLTKEQARMLHAELEKHLSNDAA